LVWAETEIQAARTSISAGVPSVVIKRVREARIRSQRARIDSYDQVDSMLLDLGRRVPSAARIVSGHEGDESTIGATYETARRWIADNGFNIVGPNRKIYLRRRNQTE
jgi:hypothetical protein